MEVRWQTEVPGRAAVKVLSIDATDGSIYVADGWGVAYAALRLRRLSLADGSELATARLGNQVRCVTRFGDELLAATDTKIFRLDPRSLEQVAPRWDRHVPRFTDHLSLDGDRLVLTNWKHDACAVIDPDEWRVRHVRPGPYPVLIDRREHVYIFSRGTGRLSRLDAGDARVQLELVMEGTPGADIAYDGRDDVFWILDGVPAVEVRTTVSTHVQPGPPTDILRCIQKGAGEERLRLDRPAQRIALDTERRRLWAIDEISTISVYDLSDLDLVARHEPPDGTHVISVAPSADVVMTATGASRAPTTTLTCSITHAA